MEKYVYARIKDLREDHQFTQSQMAKIIGKSQQQYQAWESGKYEIPLHHFIELAKFYNVSLDFLAGIKKDPTPLR